MGLEDERASGDLNDGFGNVEEECFYIASAQSEESTVHLDVNGEMLRCAWHMAWPVLAWPIGTMSGRAVPCHAMPWHGPCPAPTCVPASLSPRPVLLRTPARPAFAFAFFFLLSS